MERHQIKVIGWHLLALSAYSYINFSVGLGSISQLFCVIVHVFICLSLCFPLDGHKKIRKEHLLSMLLVLIIGLGICTKMYFPH